jgi:hypothetical protein
MKKVIVDWIDIRKAVNDETFNENDDIDDKVAKISTIGWLYKESKKSMFLVQEFTDGEVRDWIVIPKCVITKITIINKGK